MQKITTFLGSKMFMGILLLLAAIGMAVATFIETKHGTPAARELVYNARWFEVLFLLLCINLTINIIQHKLLSRKKLAVGLFHLSFIIIIIGATLTRYIGFEGRMHIREKESVDYITTAEDYITIKLGDTTFQKEVEFSEITPYQFDENFEVENEKINIKSVQFIQNAQVDIVESADGSPIINFVFSDGHSREMQSVLLKSGDFLQRDLFSVGFNSDQKADINLFTEKSQLKIYSAKGLQETSMTGGSNENIAPNDTVGVKKLLLYKFDKIRFLIRHFLPKAEMVALKSDQITNENAVVFEITHNDKKKTATIFGTSGYIGDVQSINVDNKKLDISYGAIKRKLPFSVRLNEFQLEKYPGSDSPSSYKSLVTIEDNGNTKDAEIFMNNTLTYDGYKFFQSSYDIDEKGTILSVNNDFWGTFITYIGYAMMMLGFVLALIVKNTHFRKLINQLKSTSSTVVTLAILLLSTVTAFSQESHKDKVPTIDKEIVTEFGEIWVQGVDGRIEAVTTLASEIMRKVSRRSHFMGKNPEELILSMSSYPSIWANIPLIKVSNKTLAEQLGAEDTYITVQSLFDDNGKYKIAQRVRDAYSKSPALRNRVEKELIYVDERVNIAYMIFNGNLLQLFPSKDQEKSWYKPGDNAVEYTNGDSLFIRSGFKFLTESIKKGDTREAILVINAISKFQNDFGSEILPSDRKKEMELLYNKISPFKRIFPFYLAFGFIILLVHFINIFRNKSLPKSFHRISLLLILLVFLVHNAGLIMRWYISGHAPWSNGYESLVYVAWAAMLSGFIFGKKYPMVIGMASFLTGISLFVAHLNWMNPEITNLVPVLKSYWLMLHVAIITASYGFIGLSAFIGIIVMILILIRNENNTARVKKNIKQLTIINEMSVTVGLYFLTIGTFLGGIWANESWGRYWGWDPKETWSLITIIVYSFVVHMRLMPSFRGAFAFNVATIVSFSSVIMTYFGVNYYLTGLHSYGKGVSNGVSNGVIIIAILIILLILAAYYRKRVSKRDKYIS